MKKMVFCIIPLIMAIMGCGTKEPAVAKTNIGKAVVVETTGSSSGVGLDAAIRGAAAQAKTNNGSSGVDLDAVPRDAAAQVKTNVSSSGMDLDAAIREAAGQMDRRLPASTKVALVSVGSTSTALSEYILSRLEAALVGSEKLIVVDRANLDKVREEQGFQLSGDVSDESAKAIGKLLGAGAIVTGSFIDLGDVYGLTLKAINMETAAVAVSYPVDIAKSTRITTLLASGSGAGAKPAAGGNAAASTVQTAQVPAASPAAPSAQTEYKIGDKGPGGGVVFYDMGFYMDGWRYLEAAPRDMGPAEWGANDTSVGGTSAGVGNGKTNTQHIIAKVKQLEQIGRAAQFCAAMNINGYNDWFLPSQAELNSMYLNLHKKGLGGFGNGWYWSSSEYSSSHAYAQQFSGGNQDYYRKTNTFAVRAIRQF